MRSLDAFWAKIDVRGPEDCWLWTKACYPDDYGMLGYRDAAGKSHTMRAHAFALVLATGEDQGGRFALHTCDCPPCCNPVHLYWGDQKQNMADMEERGRSARVRRGSVNGRAKISEADACAMRALYATGRPSQAELGKRYGISQAMVSEIVRGASWAHVGGELKVARTRLDEMAHEHLRAAFASGQVTQRDLAEHFGISQGYVSKLVQP